MTTIFSLGEKVTITPSVENAGSSKVPGNLSLLAPQGNGVYGFQSNINPPFLDAPQQEAEAGVVFFDSGNKKADFLSLLKLLNIRYDWKDYSIFVQSSEDPSKEGYIHQARIVNRFALRHLYGSITEQQYEKFPQQQLSIGDALWKFIETNEEMYGTHFGNSELAGKFGGDGNYAQEKTSFGFMLENSYYGVMRIWSRAWLVTK